MRVHNKIGSKERFKQIFENVNKIKVGNKVVKGQNLNEEYDQWGLKKKLGRVNEAYGAIGDPTKEEMINFLRQQYGGEYDDFSAEEAIYWYGYEYHGGQNSNLYSALSTSQYKPAPSMMNASSLDGMSKEMYNDLVSEYEGGQFSNETFDVPKDGKGGDDAYLNKGNITDVLKQTKKDGGMTDYPADGVKPEIKDPSLDGLHGDRLPFKEEDDQDVADVDSEEPSIEEPIPNDDGEEIGGEIEAELDDSPEEVGVEPETDDTAIAGIPDVAGDELAGGLGDDASANDFCPMQISKGIKVELEHTDDPKVALEIVLDHLTEDPKYYGEGGVDPEAAAMTGAQDDVHSSSYGDGEEGGVEISLEPEGEPEGDEESEILFGKMDTVGKDGTDEMPDELEFDFKPKNVGEEFDFAGQEREFYDKKYEEDDEARKEELIAKGELASPEEKEELKQLLGLEQGDVPMGGENGFGKIEPSGSVGIGEDAMYNGPDIPLKGDGHTNFQTQSEAVNAAIESMEKRGFEVNPEDVANSPFAEGWVGYDNNRDGKIPLYKNGQPTTNALYISLYRKTNGLYELTHYPSKMDNTDMQY